MKKALIHGTRICQIVGAGDEFPVAPGLTWVEVPDDATSADTWDGSAVVKWAPSPANVADVKKEASRRILARYPDWKQRNLIMEGGAEYEAMKAWIGAVRAASDAIEAQLADAPGLDIADDALWPEG
jgi:hypothetical protein